MKTYILGVYVRQSTEPSNTSLGVDPIVAITQSAVVGEDTGARAGEDEGVAEEVIMDPVVGNSPVDPSTSRICLL